MLPLPPPSPSVQSAAPPPGNQKTSKQERSQQSPAAALTRNYDSKRLRKPILLHPRPRRTNPVVWFGAILCLLFSLILILFGIATLIIYLSIKPRSPVFDTPNANLNAIYFDSPEYFNGDITFLANFSNPNQKIDVRFEYVDIELYFFDRLIGTQSLQPFTQRQKEKRLESIHIISSLVYLPNNLATELQKQVENNKVIYNIRGTFKVKATLGLFHYSYWLHGRCEIEMTGPPTGVLIARSCKTKR
ncbi:hypothetical protein P3X46_002592 [Hevea brasiliensis]|uniref:Late embryogenesis abundant protein LEA-2 subgroup domain-containing protein n=1 Tax=Hevea brasiliensis TaxID=3981 RepID=A0ABQ9N3G5_HEVBR|nr:NDR1/HIN1-like protein 2 [Hevea brasiliensis]KAJ9187096.1 hypothetical protein P3X46_002592 [Hevea brasiliensis]